ncbi:MAG: nucleotidyltransferase [Bacteroidetes bacterium 4572_128]|nr:MAG: nucleotidyltransferase [Bacteroidetes bacterium 4572_128]
MKKKEIRWKQRFINLEKAYKQLKTAWIKIPELDDLSKEGLIQRFEYTFELSWKTMKDYLEFNGFIVKSPRAAIKQAFQIEMIDDGEIWLDILEKRNLMAHIYDEIIFTDVIDLIQNQYFQEIEKLMNFFSNENR